MEMFLKLRVQQLHLTLAIVFGMNDTLFHLNLSQLLLAQPRMDFGHQIHLIANLVLVEIIITHQTDRNAC